MGKKISLTVDYGTLTIKSFSDNRINQAKKIKSKIAILKKEGSNIIFQSPITLKTGEKLTLDLMSGPDKNQER
jgi:hypothetical protein